MPDDPATAPPPSDALVLFGVTGDLAYKQIFPALFAMCRHGALNVPVIGVASSAWNVEQLRMPPRAIICPRGSWGPPQADRLAADPGGWHNAEPAS